MSPAESESAFLDFLPRAAAISPSVRSRLERMNRLIAGDPRSLSEVVRGAMASLSLPLPDGAVPLPADLEIREICRLGEVLTDRHRGIEVCFPIQSSGLEALLSLPFEPVRRIAGRILRLPRGTLDSFDVPTELERGALTYALGRIIANLTEARHPYLAGSPLLLAEVFYQSGELDTSTVGAGEWIVIRGRCRLAGVASPFTLLLPGEWLTRICTDLKRDAQLARRSQRRIVDLAGQIGSAPVEFAVIATGIVLTLEELSTLGSGDLVVPENAGHRDDAGSLSLPVQMVPYHSPDWAGGCDGTLLVNGTAACVRIDRFSGWEDLSHSANCGLDEVVSSQPYGVVAPPAIPESTLSGRSSSITPNRDGGLMNTQPPPASDVPEEGNEPFLNDLPVVLRAEIGRIVLTLGELSRLKPGMTIELCQPGDNSVTLHVEGKTVARGQLVEIDGQLGIRIEELGL